MGAVIHCAARVQVMRDHAHAPLTVFRRMNVYLWTDVGWLYLAIVLDLFNREVVGWSLKPRITTDIVTDALTMAWFSITGKDSAHHWAISRQYGFWMIGVLLNRKRNW